MRRTEVLLKLKGIDTREAAIAQRYVYVYVPESEAACELPPGEYFVHQIVGLQVLTTAGEDLGTVEEVLSTGANDVYVVPGPRGEVLIPALKTVIRTIDLATGQLIVELPPGLLATAKQPSIRRRRRRRTGEVRHHARRHTHPVPRACSPASSAPGASSGLSRAGRSPSLYTTSATGPPTATAW